MSFASFDKYIVCVLVKGGETREASAGRVRFDRIRQTSSANLIIVLAAASASPRLRYHCLGSSTAGVDIWR